MREDRYSNFNEGFGRAMTGAIVIGVYGIYSLYQFGKGDKKHIQVMAGLLGTGLLLKEGKKRKLTGKAT